MMDRQIALDEQRMAIDEEFNNRRQELGNSQRGQDPSEWERLDREQQQRFEDLDRQYQDLERERQEYWESREQQDIEYQRASSDQEADTEDWTSGPNSLSLIVDSIEGDEVVIRIEIADSDPINGWGLQLEYDKNELEFNDFVPGGFIGGSFIPLFKENDKGVQVGGAQLGGQGDMSDGSGVLGSVKLKVIGSLPAWINASSLDLKGDVENEVNLTNSQVEIER
ncbi:MAG: cohesin domain-containing protein, partial [Candidatus Latescibacterota bacterium]|nr:cohesin domain-containing protein [Candidatus Latescibacterota bacterium]